MNFKVQNNVKKAFSFLWRTPSFFTTLTRRVELVFLSVRHDEGRPQTWIVFVRNRRGVLQRKDAARGVRKRKMHPEAIEKAGIIAVEKRAGNESGKRITVVFQSRSHDERIDVDSRRDFARAIDRKPLRERPRGPRRFANQREEREFVAKTRPATRVSHVSRIETEPQRIRSFQRRPRPARLLVLSRRNNRQDKPVGRPTDSKIKKIRVFLIDANRLDRLLHPSFHRVVAFGNQRPYRNAERGVERLRFDGARQRSVPPSTKKAKAKQKI